MRAIGVVESGRHDAAGVSTPWPWTLDVAGRGAFFPTRKMALAGLEAALASGLASVDVGCFQVNLAQHPNAFASLSDGLDPKTNADYAARFLLALRDTSGSWAEAISRYHSAVLARGVPYRASVLAAWVRDPLGFAAPQANDPHVVRVAFFYPPSRGMGVRTDFNLPHVIGPR